MTIGFLITARLKSTRLKNKLLLPCYGKTLIDRMIERIKQQGKFSKIVICTSTDKSDDPLVKIAKRNGILIYRGSKEDVIVRLYNAAIENKIKYFCNIPGDNPLVDIYYANKLVNYLIKNNLDIARSYFLPIGIFCYSLKTSSLEKVIKIKKNDITEIWYHYFNKTGLFKLGELEIPKKEIRLDLRLTLDYKEDYKLIKKIFKKFKYDIPNINYKDILIFLNENKELSKINNFHMKNSIIRYKKQSKNRLKLNAINKKKIYLDYDEFIIKYLKLNEV